MVLTQMHIIACILAGSSLFLNICFSSNFIPVEEMTISGYGLYLLHAVCNFAAQVCLLNILLILFMELALTDRIARQAHIDVTYFPQYVHNFMLSALLFSLVRFVLPGPLKYFSRFFKLGVFLNLSGIVVLAVDSLLQSYVFYNENIPGAVAEIVEQSVQHPVKTVPVTTAMR